MKAVLISSRNYPFSKRHVDNFQSVINPMFEAFVNESYEKLSCKENDRTNIVLKLFQHGLAEWTKEKNIIPFIDQGIPIRSILSEDEETTFYVLPCTGAGVSGSDYLEFRQLFLDTCVNIVSSISGVPRNEVRVICHDLEVGLTKPGIVSGKMIAETSRLYDLASARNLYCFKHENGSGSVYDEVVVKVCRGNRIKSDVVSSFFAMADVEITWKEQVWRKMNELNRFGGN